MYSAYYTVLKHVKLFLFYLFIGVNQPKKAMPAHTVLELYFV